MTSLYEAGSARVTLNGRQLEGFDEIHDVVVTGGRSGMSRIRPSPRALEHEHAITMHAELPAGALAQVRDWIDAEQMRAITKNMQRAASAWWARHCARRGP